MPGDPQRPVPGPPPEVIPNPVRAPTPQEAPRPGTGPDIPAPGPDVIREPEPDDVSETFPPEAPPPVTFAVGSGAALSNPGPEQPPRDPEMNGARLREALVVLGALLLMVVADGGAAMRATAAVAAAAPGGASSAAAAPGGASSVAGGAAPPAADAASRAASRRPGLPRPTRRQRRARGNRDRPGANRRWLRNRLADPPVVPHAGERGRRQPARSADTRMRVCGGPRRLCPAASSPRSGRRCCTPRSPQSKPAPALTAGPRKDRRREDRRPWPRAGGGLHVDRFRRQAASPRRAADRRGRSLVFRAVRTAAAAGSQPFWVRAPTRSTPITCISTSSGTARAAVTASASSSR